AIQQRACGFLVPEMTPIPVWPFMPIGCCAGAFNPMRGRYWVGTPLPPLLEEERHVGSGALVAQASRPIWMHRPCTGATLPAGDNPVEFSAKPTHSCQVARAVGPCFAGQGVVVEAIDNFFT